MTAPLDSVVSSYHDVASMAALRGRVETDPNAGLREVAEQFESIFLSMMLSTARQSMVEGGLFDSPSMNTYESMFDQEIAFRISRDGGIGLADLIVQQLGGNPDA